MKVSSLSNIKIGIILLILGVSLYALQLSHLRTKEQEKTETYLRKLQPNEWQFRQRAYPVGELDMQAYRKAQKFRKDQVEKKIALSKTGLSNNEWEFAGPTNIGGRITDVEVTANVQRIYTAAASGGIFVSADRGLNWEAVFDNENSLSIGDMALAPTNDSIMYVGTGEANAGGGSLAYDGDGIYKSNDAGKTWSYIGLPEIGSVGKVLVHPKNPEEVFVAAMGPLFKNSTDRGVYKSSNGGFSWSKILYKNDSTGFIDFAMHPDHPDTLYAAAWERIRRPDRRDYGGPSSGICRSYNGGMSWEELGAGNGLPDTAGRIGIAISPSSPNILYSSFVHPDNGQLLGVYKSTDFGDNWTSLPIDGISDVPFMWWFGKIFIDPANPDIVYLTALDMHKSIDGGNTWTTIFTDAHVDQHALGINPDDAAEIYLGNDGGLYKSLDRGENHEKINNLAITQFYTVEIDESLPSRLYGGTQDNGTNRTLTGATDDWGSIFGGDGFYVLVDPRDNDFVYAEAQNGFFARSIDGGISFSPATNGIIGARRGWNSPVVFNPRTSRILYFGASKLFKSTDRAENWTAISPDLTKGGGSGNLVFGVLTSVSVSPLDTSVIFTGADDGTLSVTRDGGANWNNISPNLPDRWITRVLADSTTSRGAYATFSGYRFGSNTGHVYKTPDLGSSWADISGDLPDVPVNDIIQTAYNGNLYIATDVGVFYSKNEGGTWELLGMGIPNLVVTDLDYHAASKILVAASYGRGLYRISLEENIASFLNPEFESINLSLFPNPATDKATLSLNLEKAGDFSLSIRNMEGRELVRMQELALQSGENDLILEIGKLSAGIYFVELIEERQALRGSLKLLKQ
ncbi:MAG: T9SS type A sorting domain-containing protein [Bacteroidota bacterium]